MKLSTTYVQGQSLLILEAEGVWTEGEDCEAFRDQLQNVGFYGVSKLLLDYSKLVCDMSFDELERCLDAADAIAQTLKNVKTVAVLNDKLKLTSAALAVLFTKGVWITIQPRREPALTWLARNHERPAWLPEVP